MANNYTIKQIAKEFEQRGYKLLEKEYKNVNTKMKYICLKHEDKGILQIDYEHFKRGQGCPCCSTRHRPTFEEVKQMFEDRGYELLETQYINNSTRMRYICPKHKDKGILTITYADLRLGRGCAYCAKRAKRTPEEYEKELKEIFPNIIPLENYVNLKTKIKHKCLICGEEWYAVPTNLLHLKEGCPRCGKNHRRTQEELEEDIKKINPNIKVLGEFSKVANKIEFECLVCGHKWFAKPNNILNGKGCPFCKKSSKGEKVIYNYLKEKNINFVFQKTFEDCKNINVLPFDFYLPELNVCIEYDGIYHYKPIPRKNETFEEAEKRYKETKIRDEIKTQYCIKNNIKLLRIPYFEFDNITTILSSFLQSNKN